MSELIQGNGGCKGPPHEDSPFRCQGKSTQTGQRCRIWAAVGRKYCRFHGGHQRRGPRANRSKYGDDRTSLVYDKYLGQTLSSAMASFVSKPHDEAVTLYHELGLARTVAAQAVQLCGIAWDSEKVDAETKMKASSIMVASLDRVKELVLAVAKIEKDAEDKVSLKVVILFQQQIIQAIYNACGADIELGARIEHAIRENVRVPKPGKEAIDESVVIPSPAEVVAAMDESTLGVEITVGNNDTDASVE